MDENLVRQTHRATYPKENTQNTMRIAMYLIMTEEKKNQPLHQNDFEGSAKQKSIFR
jgi:hypothetical protein